MLDYDSATGTMTLSLSGDYGSDSRRRIIDAIVSILRLQGVENIVFDLQHVTALDPAAVDGMVAARRICLSQGKRLKVAHPSTPVAQALRVTFADSLFPAPEPAGL